MQGMTQRLVQEIAETIVDDLFINGQGEEAQRLVLMNRDERPLGGWSRAAVTERIARTLKEHIEP
jgi:hypothetical protein